MSKVVVLIGSVRKNGNTELLANRFIEGAGKNNQVEVISVSEYKVSPCIGCNSCFSRENNACFNDDDMSIIYEKLANADVVVIASPIYFYGISAQLKAIVDRLHTPMRNSFNIKKLGLLLVGAAELENLFDPIIMQYRMVCDFFHLEDAGMVLVRGVKNKGDIIGRPEMEKAYELGLSIK